MITASAVNGTEIFEIVVTNPDNQKAELIANTIADVLPKKIANIVEGSSVRIVDYAIVPAYPVSPSVTKYTAIGLLFSGMLSVGIIVLMELMNESIRSEDYLLQTYRQWEQRADPVESVSIRSKTERKKNNVLEQKETKTSVYKGYKQDKIEMRGDRAEMSDFPLYLNTVAGGLDRRDQTIGGFSFVVKIYAVPVVEIIG